MLTEFGGAPFSVFKGALTDVAVTALAPIAAEMNRLLADPGHIDAVLRAGGERARALAAKTLAAVQDIVGILRP